MRVPLASAAPAYVHLIADLVGVAEAQLRDASLLCGLIIAAAGAVGLAPLGMPLVRSLPQGCEGFCLAFTADAVAFKSASVGYAAGGNQCGGAVVTQCRGMIWKTTNGGASWKIAVAW